MACLLRFDFLGVKTTDDAPSSSSVIDVPPGPKETLSEERFLGLEDAEAIEGPIGLEVASGKFVSVLVQKAMFKSRKSKGKSSFTLIIT